MQKILLLFFLPLLVVCQQNDNNLKSAIDELLSTLPESTEYSIFIYDPNMDDTLYTNNENLTLIPASNIKLFTTSAALNMLGPEHNLSVLMLTDDENIPDGAIMGNLYLKGFGNSLFTYADLDSLVKDLADRGIKKITGDIVCDDTFFDSLYTRDDWIVDEHANVNLPAVSALVVDKNKFALTLSSNINKGELLDYSITPKNSYVEVNVSAKVTGSRSRPKIVSNSTEKKMTIEVKGGMTKSRRKKSWAIFVEQPPIYISYLVKDLLEEYGIEVEGKPKKGSVPENLIELYRSSVLLKDLIEKINKKSDNYLAECLFKTLGAYYSNEQGNSFFATQAVISFADEIGVNTTDLSIVDGSGISRFNKLSASSIIELLTYMYLENNLFQDFYNSLANAAVDGTLEDRMIGTYAENNFRGKTGTLNGVCSIAGYLTTRSQNDLIIAILMEFKINGANYYRNIQDKIIAKCAEML